MLQPIETMTSYEFQSLVVHCPMVPLAEVWDGCKTWLPRLLGGKSQRWLPVGASHGASADGCSDWPKHATQKGGKVCFELNFLSFLSVLLPFLPVLFPLLSFFSLPAISLSACLHFFLRSFFVSFTIGKEYKNLKSQGFGFG